MKSNQQTVSLLQSVRSAAGERSPILSTSAVKYWFVLNHESEEEVPWSALWRGKEAGSSGLFDFYKCFQTAEAESQLLNSTNSKSLIKKTHCIKISSVCRSDAEAPIKVTVLHDEERNVNQVLRLFQFIQSDRTTADVESHEKKLKTKNVRLYHVSVCRDDVTMRKLSFMSDECTAATCYLGLIGDSMQRWMNEQ